MHDAAEPIPAIAPPGLLPNTTKPGRAPHICTGERAFADSTETFFTYFGT